MYPLSVIRMMNKPVINNIAEPVKTEVIEAKMNKDGFNPISGTEWNSFEACGLIEGFGTVKSTNETTVEAWAYLISNGSAWNLQGFYGRGAMQMIESGMIDKSGHINWDKFYEVLNEQD